MKRSLVSSIACLAVITFVFSSKAFSQTVVESVPAGTVSDAQRSDTMNRQATSGADVHSRGLDSIASQTGAHRISEPDSLASHTGHYYHLPSAQLSSKLKRELSPSAADREANASFLRQPDTGIFRLLGCQRVIDANDLGAGCVDVPIDGHGAYYSFTKRRNDLDEWSDLALRNNTLQGGVNDNTIGMLTALGDVPLESVTLETPAASFLAKLVPPSNPTEAQRQIESLAHGLKIEGYALASSLPVAVNTTYLLRSTKYKKSDALIAFRVIRQEPSSSVTIIWKQLQKFHTPSLNSKHNQ